MIKKKLFVWVCDYSENSGEGKLARLFIKKLNDENKFKLIFNQKKILKNKYISTIQGIIYCWNKYLKKEKVCYLNYLPFWNFMIFVLLPPNTLLGPITGGANFLKSNNLHYFIRANIFPIFYKISEFSILFRNINITFSTDLLKKYLFFKTIKKSKFNFVFTSYFLKKKRKKKIDFLIYYRKHKNKESLFPYDFINKLVKKNYKIYVVGDKLNIPFVKNCGRISNKKVLKLQSIAKYTVASGENLYSFFTIECLSNNVKIIVNKNEINKITSHRDKIIKINYNNIKDLKKLKKI